jgi:uncharacterized repeat protein (TIGR01451 family)
VISLFHKGSPHFRIQECEVFIILSAAFSVRRHEPPSHQAISPLPKCSPQLPTKGYEVSIMSLAALSVLPERLTRVTFSLFVLALAALLPPATARAQTTYSGGGAAFTTSSPATGVTSTITVSGAPGTVATVEVQLLGVKSTSAEYTTGPYANQASYDSLGYAEFLLVGPGGAQLVLLYQTGSGIDGCDENQNPVPSCDGLQGSTSGTHPDTITIVDGAHSAPNGAGSLGEQYEGWQTAYMPYTVEPSSYSNYDGDFPPPLPTAVNTADYPQSDGGATLNGRFGGTQANGTWTLYLIDNDPYPGVDPFSITGWNLILTFSAATPTTTTLSSSANPASYPNSATSGSVTFTATVTSSSGTPTGTVTFQANGSNISGCGAVALSGGVAHCTVSLAQGNNSIAAQYTPSGSFGQSSTSMTQLMEVTAENTSGYTWCNNSLIADPINGNPGLAYPSVIKIPSGTYSKSVANVTVELENVQGTTNGISGQFLLVAPSGGTQNLDFFDSGFSQPGGATSEVNLTFEDTASGYVPISTPAASGTFLPTDDNEGVNPDYFPTSTSPSIDSNIPQVPSKVNFALPYGQDNNDYKPYTNIYTFGEAFNGATANGDWALYSTVGEGANVNSGWCITFTFNSGSATTTAVTSGGNNPATTGQPVTFTATVTSGGNPVTSGGTVTFLDNNAAPAGTVSGNNVVTLNGSGVATFTTSSLTEGDHTITANYSGTSSDNESFSAVLHQRINTATTVTNVSSNTWQYCNPGAVLIHGGTYAGPFTPNPSVISVINLPGTLNTVGVQLTNFSVNSTYGLMELASLVEGPSGAALDFFSNTTQGSSGNSTASAGNYIFEDSAGSEVSSGNTNLSPGDYKPTAYESYLDAGDTFTSSTSGQYPAPTAGNFSYAAPTTLGASSTFADVFTNGSDANGAWLLFFSSGFPNNTFGAANGWCVNLTENLPSLAQPTLAHAGTFSQGEQNAAYTVNITNNGPGSTGDPTGTSPLKVTDTLNSAFSYSNYSGTGWSCSAAGQTVNCTNDFPVADGASYPTLTIDVNVANSASGSINNTVSVSGAGVIAINSNTDSVTIQTPPVLAVSKTHSGGFTQGSTAVWSIAVSNNAAASSQTSGTTTVSDMLPTGYTLSGNSGSGWSCSGTVTVNCNSSQVVSDGGSFSTLQLTVNVPANSPTSVSNTAAAWGGGDLTHTSSGTAATSNTDTVSVVQVPASIVVSGGGTQSTAVSTAFAAPLSVLVEDAAGVPINNASVTFTAPASGASGTFSNSSNTLTVNTNASGVASAGTFTANANPGAYSVTASVSGLATQATFSLTNSLLPPSISEAFELVSTIAAAPIGANESGSTVTITTMSMHGFLTGQSVTIAGVGVAGYNGTFTIANVPTPTTFTYTVPNTGLAASGGGTATVLPITTMQLNGTVVLAFTLTNPNSSAPLTGVSFTDALPSGLAVAATPNASAPCGTFAPNAGDTTINFTGGALPDSAICNVSVNITATAAGVMNNTTGVVTSTNGGVGNTASASLTVDQPPAFISASSTTFEVNVAGSFSITASPGYPTNAATLAVSNILNAVPGVILPSSGTGSITISGTPTASGTETFTITATNGAGLTAQQNFTLTVDQAPAITSASGATFSGRAPNSFTVTASGFPASITFSETGVLPSGITFSTAGTLSGTLANGTDGSYPITITASNGVSPAATQSFTLTVTGVGTPAPATLTSPTPGTAFTGNSVTFTWAPVAGATGYVLFLGSTGAGSINLLDAHTTAATVTANNLPVNGETIYARLITNFNGVNAYNDYTFTAVSPATLTSPAANATLAGSSQAFTWNPAAGATGYALCLGSTGAGSCNLFDGHTTGNTLTVNNLPVNGETIYARLITGLNGGAYAYTDSTFTAFSSATLTSPAANATLAGSSQIFTWNPATGATGYAFCLGSTGVGSCNLYDGHTTGNTLTANNLPVNGETIYARLITGYNGGAYAYNDYTFTAVSPATLTSPAANATLAGSSQIFTWNPAAGATGYALCLGSTGVGSCNLFDGHTTGNTITANNLPVNGETIYARLITGFSGGAYAYTDSTLTAK